MYNFSWCSLYCHIDTTIFNFTATYSEKFYYEIWCHFASAAVTSYHKLGGLNNRNVSSHDSGGQKSKMKMSAGTHSLPRLWKRICSLILPTPGGSRGTWPWQHPSSLCLHGHMASASSLGLPPLAEDMWLYLGPSKAIPGKLLLSGIIQVNIALSTQGMVKGPRD